MGSFTGMQPLQQLFLQYLFDTSHFVVAILINVLKTLEHPLHLSR